MRRAALIALAGASVVAAALPSAAAARWSDAQLVSVDNGKLEQADGGTNAVDLSGDGRWVVFQTTATNFFADDDPDAPDTMRRGGIYRFDRTTGAIALVADGDLLDEDDDRLLRRGAARPSVSDDGRWVVFSTAQRLVPQDDNGNIDVYVRDMSVPLSGDRAGSGAYQLVSARDGGDEPAHYEPVDPPLEGGDPGSDVTAGQALSGDGRYVAFRTTELRSDLPAGAGLDTSPYNVFVRDLRTKRTVLVTRASDDGAPAGGGLGPVVLSRDGSTVSWVGRNAARQTRFVGGENTDDAAAYYLWRRWDDAGAGTRRVTGIADPDDPGCVGSITLDPLATGPCYGPLSDTDAGFNDIGNRVPALSADGWTVAFLSGAPPRPAQDSESNLDVYVASMRPGVSRKQGTRVVTRATSAPNPAVNGEISSVGMNADGSRLVLVTTRRQFLPPAPPLTGDPRSSAGSAELYTVDLGAGGTIRRVLRPGGADLGGAVDADPALSADGTTIAFVSTATNLVSGDANQQADAFAVTETPDQQTAAPPSGLGEDPIDDDIAGDSDDLGLRAVSRRDGSVLLRVAVPAAGAISAVADVPVASRAARARRRRASAKRGAGAKPSASKGRRRRVASARARARARATVQLVLKLARRDLLAVRRGAPLRARVTVTFTPAIGGRRRSAGTTARFRVVVKQRRAAPKRGNSKSR